MVVLEEEVFVHMEINLVCFFVLIILFVIFTIFFLCFIFPSFTDQVIPQLNTPQQIYYTYQGTNAMLASFVGNTDIDSAAELANWDVVMLAGSGQGNKYQNKKKK
jgi:hypothetical protein